jgi:hypothetical protein
MPELREAARRGDLITIKRLVDNGVSVTERSPAGTAALILASANGHVVIVKYFLKQGASIIKKSNGSFTGLLAAASNDEVVLMQYLLEEARANIAEATNDGQTVWVLLKPARASPELLTSLLKVIIMLGDAPLDFFVAKLSPVHAELITRGRQYRGQLPPYLEQQRALVGPGALSAARRAAAPCRCLRRDHLGGYVDGRPARKSSASQAASRRGGRRRDE